MSLVVPIDPVPEEEKNLTVGIYAVNIALHVALVAIVEYYHLLGRSGVDFPTAPEQAAAGEMEQVHSLINQIAEAGLRNTEGGEHTVAVMGEEVAFRFFKYEYGF